jgi:hypothetical protein
MTNKIRRRRRGRGRMKGCLCHYTNILKICKQVLRGREELLDK